MDVEVVREVAASVGAPLVIRHLAPPERPTEAWARASRYEALFEVAQRLGCSMVATAHTADDQAETVLMRILRGVGREGLAGILLKSTPIDGVELIRPLLSFRKSELEDYVRRMGLPTSIDESNYDLSLLRNRVRLRLLPLLESEYRRGSVEALSRLALAVQSAPSPLIETIERSFFGFREVLVEREAVEDRPYALHGALRRATEVLTGRRAAVPQDVTFRILNGLLAGESLRLSLVADVVAEVGGEGVVLYRRSTPESESVILDVPGSVDFCGVEFQAEVFEREEVGKMKGAGRFVEFFDADGVGARLLVRCIREGDRFCPLGSDKKCKVFRFLLNRGVPQRVRRFVPLVMTEDDEPLWLVPFRIDERFKVRDETERVLRIEVRSDDVWAL